MTNQSSNDHVSRRAALVGLGASGLGLALASTLREAAAKTMSTADHPLMGMWLAMANPPRRGKDPLFPAPSLFAADGTVILGFLPAQIGMDGAIQYTGAPMGVWAPHDEQTGHFTAVQVLADKTGTLTGTLTIDGHPKVSADGMTFTDDGSLVTVTIRNVAGAIVQVIPPGVTGFPVNGIKMRVGNPGFPGDEKATPTP